MCMIIYTGLFAHGLQSTRKFPSYESGVLTYICCYITNCTYTKKEICPNKVLEAINVNYSVNILKCVGENSLSHSDPNAFRMLLLNFLVYVG